MVGGSLHPRESASMGMHHGGGVCVQGGLHPGVCIGEESASRGCIKGVCIQWYASGGWGWADHPMGYYRMWSTSGWYVFHWNAFLFIIYLDEFIIYKNARFDLIAEV